MGIDVHPILCETFTQEKFGHALQLRASQRESLSSPASIEVRLVEHGRDVGRGAQQFQVVARRPSF